MNVATISAMSRPFISAMVNAMYAWEAAMHDDPNLVNDNEAVDFYDAYMGGLL